MSSQKLAQETCVVFHIFLALAKREGFLFQEILQMLLLYLNSSRKKSENFVQMKSGPEAKDGNKRFSS